MWWCGLVTVVLWFLFSIQFYHCFLSVIVAYCIRKLKGLRVRVFSNVNLPFKKHKYKPFPPNEPDQGRGARAGLLTNISVFSSPPGLREVPHLLHADLHSQWRGRHSAPGQDWATPPGLWHDPGPAAAPASQDPQGPPGQSSHQDLRDASQWYWQVQPGRLPHHVHHLPPDVLDDLPEPGRGRPWRHCLSPAGLGNYSHSPPLVVFWTQYFAENELKSYQEVIAVIYCHWMFNAHNNVW